MKFKVQQEEFSEALGHLARNAEKIGNRTELIRFELITSNSLLLKAFNQNLQIDCKLDVIGAEGNNFSIEAQKLNEIVKRLSGLIEFDNGEIKSGKNKFKLSTVDEELPNVKFPEGEPIKINSKTLIDSLNQTVFASDIDGILSGVSILGSEICGTDGSVLALSKAEKDITENQIIIPKYLAVEISKCFPNDDIEIISDDIKIAILNNKIQLVSSLIEGQYPKYNNFIPEFTEKVIIDKDKLLKSLDLISIVQDNKNRECKIEFNKNELIISANSPNSEGKTSLEIDFDKEHLFIFDTIKLTNCIKNSNSDILEFCFDADCIGKNKLLIKSGENNIKLIVGRIKKNATANTTTN